MDLDSALQMARRDSQQMVELTRQSSSNTLSVQTPIRKRKRQVIPDSSDEDHSGLSVKKLSKSQLSKTVPTSFVITKSLFTKILKGCESIKIEKLDKIVVDVCKYWALKRQSKRGVPLLKRLLVEPWTKSTKSKAIDENTKLEEYKVTLEYLNKEIKITHQKRKKIIFPISYN